MVFPRAKAYLPKAWHAFHQRWPVPKDVLVYHDRVDMKQDEHWEVPSVEVGYNVAGVSRPWVEHCVESKLCDRVMDGWRWRVSHNLPGVQVTTGGKDGFFQLRARVENRGKGRDSVLEYEVREVGPGLPLIHEALGKFYTLKPKLAELGCRMWGQNVLPDICLFCQEKNQRFKPWKTGPFRK